MAPNADSSAALIGLVGAGLVLAVVMSVWMWGRQAISRAQAGADAGGAEPAKALESRQSKLTAKLEGAKLATRRKKWTRLQRDGGNNVDDMDDVDDVDDVEEESSPPPAMRSAKPEPREPRNGRDREVDEPIWEPQGLQERRLALD